MSDQYYPEALAALCLNFSECVWDAYEPESEEAFNRLVEKALALAGYSDLDMEKMDKSLGHYMEAFTDLHSLPEYEQAMPDLD